VPQNGLDTGYLRKMATLYVRHLPDAHQNLAKRYLLDADEDAETVAEMGFIQLLESDFEILEREPIDGEA